MYLFPGYMALAPVLAYCVHTQSQYTCMMTSSNENIFHVTESVTGDFPSQKPMARICDFFLSATEQTVD